MTRGTSGPLVIVEEMESSGVEITDPRDNL